MRRVWLGVVVTCLLFVSPAAAKTLRVNWTEYHSFGDGQATFHITKVVITPTSWSATASVTNRSSLTLSVTKPPTQTYPTIKGLWDQRNSGFGVAFQVPASSSGSGGYFVRPATFATPALPTTLAPGATWRGTFGGTAKLPRRNDLRLSFGSLAVTKASQSAWIGQTFNRITDHTFRI